jgi:hypothetical protein
LAVKAGLFSAVALVVLFPRLDLAWRQAWQLRDWDALIDPNLPAMPAINAEINARLPAGATAAQELAAVQKFAYEKIPYCFDWFNWGNVDYWPTAAEVWERKREDCDGRAVLVASILRSRGFSTARLAGNLSHVWVAIDPDDPKAASTRTTGLLGPQKSQMFSRRNGRVVVQRPKWESVLPALVDFSRFPAWRMAALLVTSLVLLYHPCRHAGGFGFVCSAALLGLGQFYYWGGKPRGTAEAAPGWELGLAIGLVLTATVLAAVANRFLTRRTGPVLAREALPQI